MMARQTGTGNMRIGLLTILTMVIVLVLAVLSVLEVTTTSAMTALTARQATMTTEAYRAETCGQQLVARIDAQLAQSRSAGADRQAALDALSSRLSGISSVVSDKDANAIARISGTTVEGTVTTSGGRTLTLTLNVTDNLTCEVAAWKLEAVVSDEKDATNLWSGPATN